MALPQPTDPPAAADPSAPPAGLQPSPPPATAASVAGHGAPAGPRPAHSHRIDWDDWLRAVERQRRALARVIGETNGHPLPLPADFYVAATRASFEIDGLSSSPGELAAALAPGAAGKACRSRQSQRIRNHVAVLHHAQLLFRRGQPLHPDDIIRWYTAISCGLSNSALDDSTRNRLASIVTRINSPQMRLRPAVEDAAQLHHRLLTEPFVPAFNGIVARVVLHYHLSRCGLPTVVFDSKADRAAPTDEASLTRRLMHLIGARYEEMLM
jgi:hypothetical protein